MKIRHRVPIVDPPSARVDEGYEAEVQDSVRRGEAAWRAAAKAVERAERRIRRLEAKRSRTAATPADDLEMARRELLKRYDELRQIEALMQDAPGSTRSGRGTVRNPLPKGSKL